MTATYFERLIVYHTKMNENSEKKAVFDLHLPSTGLEQDDPHILDKNTKNLLKST
jgi:hypothetical protein